MKKLLLIFLSIFLFTGCFIHRLSISQKDVSSIVYDEDTIQKEDYQEILEILNKIDFHEVKEEESSVHQLLIHTKNEIFQLQISEANTIHYKKDQKIYISKETNEVKKLVKVTEKLIKKYRDTSFLNISMQNTLDSRENDFIVRIDKEDQYIKITSSEGIRNFKIHRLDYFDDQYHDVDLLYEKNVISPDEAVYIRIKIPEKIGTIKISFETKNGYIYTAIPTLSDDKNKLNLHESISPK